MNSLEFAINMELDGERYYREQAEINKGNVLNAVFLYLAEDEQNHAQILKNKFSELSYDLKDNSALSKVKNVFKGVNDIKKGIAELPKQLDLYKEALEKEKISIDLYKNLLLEATEEQEKKLFEYLVGQETDHFVILEEVILLVSRPEEWVESAEFGIREEY